jgi:hypothetical protein
MSGFSIFTRELDLSTARTNERDGIGLCNCLLVESIADSNVNLSIKFNSPSQKAFSLKPGQQLIFRDFVSKESLFFEDVYYTNTAGTGKALLTFSNNVEILETIRSTSDGVISSVKSQIVTVGATATPIPTTALTNRVTMTLYNGSGSTVYLGGSTVTLAAGFAFLNGTTFTIAINEGATLYGIAAAPTLIYCIEGA